MLQAMSLIQVGLRLFRHRHAVGFSTATMCTFQLWRGSRISLLAQKEGLQPLSIGIVEVR